MTIEIRKPELEALIEERLRSGAFQNVEDILLDALKPKVAPPEESRRRLLALLDKENEPIWKPEDHPEIDDNGDWVRQSRAESDERFNRLHF